jgi:hypothetical protein
VGDLGIACAIGERQQRGYETREFLANTSHSKAGWKGYIENETAGRLREMAKISQCSGPCDFSTEVSAELVEILLKQLQAIASNTMSIADHDKM